MPIVQAVRQGTQGARAHEGAALLVRVRQASAVPATEDWPSGGLALAPPLTGQSVHCWLERAPSTEPNVPAGHFWGALPLAQKLPGEQGTQLKARRMLGSLLQGGDGGAGVGQGVRVGRTEGGGGLFGSAGVSQAPRLPEILA